MKTLYLIRHSETNANIKGNIDNTGPYMCGSTNVHLSENGIEMCKKFDSNILKDVEEIYISELNRTKETAEIICKNIVKEKQIKLKQEKALNEIYFGIYEMFSKNILPEEILNKWNNDANNLTFTGGDSLKERAEEIYNFVIDLMENSSSKNIVLISSNTILRLLLTKLENKDLNSFHDYDIKNLDVIEINFLNNLNRNIIISYISNEEIFLYKKELEKEMKLQGAIDIDISQIKDSTIRNNIKQKREPKYLAWALLQ